mgnify:CR=1 FL=1
MKINYMISLDKINKFDFNKNSHVSFPSNNYELFISKKFIDFYFFQELLQ